MKTAILGVGRMGRRHIQVVRQLEWDLVGVYDTQQASLKLALDEYSLSNELLFDDLDELFSATNPECLIVATTADSHCALTCMAAERGAKYILVEKPMAVSLKQCDQMLAVCERHGAKLAANHQMRFMDQYLEPKRLFATDAYGSLASMTVIAGNFGYSMNGTHYVEAFRFLTDEYLAEVTAWFSPNLIPNPRGPQFQDRAGSIRATTVSGKRLYMEIGADQGHGIQHIYACRNGMITFNELTGELLSSEREEQYRELPTTRYGMPAIDSRQMLQPSELINSSAAVLTALVSDVNSVSGEDGRRVVEFLVAAYQSAEAGNIPVLIDEKLDQSRIFPWA